MRKRTKAQPLKARNQKVKDEGKHRGDVFYLHQPENKRRERKESKNEGGREREVELSLILPPCGESGQIHAVTNGMYAQ